MKIILLILLAIVTLQCKPSECSQVFEYKDTTISKIELAQIIDTLSLDYFEGRKTGSSGIDKAAIYIENFLTNLNIKPYFEQFRDSFSIENIQGYNVIGLIDGTDPVLKNEYLILSAHYDHIGKKSGQGDSVFNGANDNASGVSTVLNIAKIIAEKKTNKRSIIVAFFAGEEMGLLGSEHFATKLQGKSKNIYSAVNIDMIGSILTKQAGKVYLSGYQKSNMPEIFNQYIGNEAVVFWNKETLYGLFAASDNFPLYQILHIPAHTFCTFDFSNYTHYHKLTDEKDKIDMDNTLIIANSICLGFLKISESAERQIKLTK